MPADTDIGNMALSRLGTRATIADLTENSTEARQINLWYATVRDDLQSLVDWNFNRVSQALAASGTPPARWASSYAYPSDCLKMRRLDFGAASWVPAIRQAVSRSPPAAAVPSSTATRTGSRRSTPRG